MKLLPGAINFANVHFVSIMLQLEFLCQDSAHNISTSCRLMQSFVGFGKKRGDNKKGNIWFFGLCQPYNFCCFDFILSCLHFLVIFSKFFLHLFCNFFAIFAIIHLFFGIFQFSFVNFLLKFLRLVFVKPHFTCFKVIGYDSSSYGFMDH